MHARSYTADRYIESPIGVSLSKEVRTLGAEDGTWDSSALAWWRSKAPKDYTPGDAQTLRNTLASVVQCDDEQWHRAISGHAVAAVGVALRVAWHREQFGISVDEAMTALLACAVEGNLTAIFVLSEGLRRSKLPAGYDMLADLWLVASLHPPLAPTD